MADFFGECLCGDVRYKASGTPKGWFFCHCSRCRKESGTTHCANIFIDNATLSWTKGENNLTHFELKGTSKARAFCNKCGSAMPRVEGKTFVVIPAGSLDSDCNVIPTAHIFYQSRADWEDKLASLTKFDGLPS